MRVFLVLMGLGCLFVEGCAPEDRCMRDSLRSLEGRALSIPDPDVRRALATGACDQSVPALLLASVALQESNFDPDAVGARGARGLLQVRPRTAQETSRQLGMEWRGSDSLYEPGVNALLGAAYLRTLRAKFGSWEAALSAYNMGPTRLRRQIDRGRGASSPYARAVLTRWSSWTDPDTGGDE